MYSGGKYLQTPSCEIGAAGTKEKAECAKAKRELQPLVQKGKTLFLLIEGKQSGSTSITEAVEFAVTDWSTYSGKLDGTVNAKLLTNNASLGLKPLKPIKTLPILKARKDPEGMLLKNELIGKLDMDGDGFAELVYQCADYEGHFYERLQLRSFELSDAEFIVEILNDPAFIKFIADRNVRTIQDAENYISNGPHKSYRENGFGLWLVSIKGTGEPIGMCGLIKRDSLEHVDIGFAFLPQYTGKGYAFEIASATQAYAKQIGVEKVIAIVSPGNGSSIKLLSKIGLQFEKLITMPGEEEPVMLFS